ncbi:hypothetical protein EKK58_09230 [Candidatus Dependentiae bacterium]|nr:MAG: hypothetical protein EKK58_09230 [Candidatus Dependentiae bacterium]
MNKDNNQQITYSRTELEAAIKSLTTDMEIYKKEYLTTGAAAFGEKYNKNKQRVAYLQDLLGRADFQTLTI